MEYRKKNTSLHGEPYGNNKVLSMHGKLLFKCSRKRIDWYLKKGLANLVSETDDQIIIKLNFDAGGPGCEGDAFCLSEKRNICVVCGSKDNLSRHHIVPYGYRKFFPLEQKDHNAHDVLLLCIPCHHKYEEFAREFKKSIADEYNAPYKGKHLREMHRLRKVYSYAKNLLNHDGNIPNIKKQRMYKYIVGVTGYKDITTELLSKLVSEGESQNINAAAGFKTHEQMVVENLVDLQSFIYNWRSHFLETMKPSYMPNGWSIDYQHRYNNR